MSKFTEGSWQGSFTVNNERTVQTFKPSFEQKKSTLREFAIPSRPEFASKYADWLLDWFSCVFKLLVAGPVWKGFRVIRELTGK